jgi:hypothetical protein
MLLTIDIGNSQVVWGVFQDSKLVGSWRLATKLTKTADEYGILLISLLKENGFSPTQITGSIISSVVPPLTPVFQKLVESFFHHSPLVVSTDFPLGLTLRSTKPESLLWILGPRQLFAQSRPRVSTSGGRLPPGLKVLRIPSMFKRPNSRRLI